jgi:HD-GYP domain-containing protein (c-di-GMP phosphodiesterase class II)
VTQQTDSTREFAVKLHQLNEIGIALSQVKEIGQLTEQILFGAKAITGADGGSLYTVTSDNTLKFELVTSTSLDINWGGPGQPPVLFPEIPLYNEDGTPNERMVACYAVLQERTVNIPDAYCTKQFDFAGTRDFDVTTGYRSTSFLTVPMKDHQDHVIGVLQLINALDPSSGEPRPFTELEEQMVESLASQAAVAITNKRLIQHLNALLEGFIESIAGAIDEQSPFTGGHCRRVPVIAQDLAEAISTTEKGPYADFQFSTEEFYELRLASLLHDCGKVSTPIHILDKATRLQTVYDRIELIRTRVAVIHKEIELREARGEITAEERAQQLSKLAETLAFLEESNHAQTTMTEEKQKRVTDAAQETWTDEAGSSQRLLNDLEEENLKISHGTLNESERKIIQDHVSTTTKMLENLPYPKHLCRIPEIAGSHHEWINGRGYPRGIKGDQMSVQARLLCIADVFEALTAPDRPYKKLMPLSLALEILKEQADRGHLDPILVDHFISEKVYLRFAREHLSPEQLDVQ